MKIIVNSEVGREVNPYDNGKCSTWLVGCLSKEVCICKLFDAFEQSVQSFPAIGIADGEHEVELVWQELFAGKWYNLKSFDERSSIGKWRQTFALTHTELEINL